MTCIEAHGLRKTFGTTTALDGIDIKVESGRILGLIGPNGAGKSTMLQRGPGLIPYEGSLTVLGQDPWRSRDQLMRDVCFIADVAVLPRWMRVWQSDRLCRRRASALRPRESRDVSCAHPDQEEEQGARICPRAW